MPKKIFSHDSTRASVTGEIDAEMRFHLDARTEELVRIGHSPEDARRIALEEYGDVAAARAELADIDRRRVGKVAFRDWMSSWSQDIRFALRGLRARPGFALTVLFTLAIGIGANAAIFTVVDSVLLRPLPYKEPDRLVHLWESYQGKVESRSEASYPDYLDWTARTKTFASLGGYQGGGFLFGGDSPATIGGAKATANFFDVLGVRAALGRTFAPGEDAVGAPRVVLLTHGFWMRQFAGNANVLGQTIMLNGNPTTIVGVLPKEFLFSRQGAAEVWVPIDRGQAQRQQRGNHWLNVVARLKPGVTQNQAASDFSGVMHQLEREYPESNSGRDGLTVPLHEELVGSIRPILLLLYGAVVVVLLIACVNVANLLLIRGADRQREIAVRVALGAGKARLVRQLLTESLILAVIGGGLGLIVARLGLSGLLSVIPAQQMRGLPPLGGIGLDVRIIGYAMLVALGTGLLFGIIPASALLKSTVHDSLRSSRGIIGGGRRLRDGLVVGEIALTVMLLSGAALFGRSLTRLLAIDPGFRVERLMTTNVAVPGPKYQSNNALVAAYARLEQNLREIPGVENVGMISKMPLDFGNSLSFAIVGQPAPDPGRRPSASYRQTTPEYFRTLGIPLASGRAFTAGDDSAAAPVVIVNRTLANAYFDGRDPVGQRIVNGRDTLLIVGMVGDVPIGKIEDKIPPTLYYSYAQLPQTQMAIAIRSTADASQIDRSVRQALKQVDPDGALTPLRTMSDLITDSPSVFMRRFPLFLVGAFAATALALAIVGIYGVVSYSVAQRTREMGIRMALGAQPGSLMTLVMRHGGWMAGAGIVLGVVGAVLSGRYAVALLYGVTPTDPLTYTAVAVVLAIVAVAATVLPARRATRVDPALALRSE